MRKNKRQTYKSFDYHKMAFSLRWSPEIEFVLPNENSFGLLSQDLTKHIKGKWDMVSECGLGEYGYELIPKIDNHLHYDKSTWKQLQTISRLIKKHKGRVTNSCGGHIHIDASKLSNSHILKIVQEFTSKQMAILGKFHVDKERVENYCALLNSKKIKRLTCKHIANMRKDKSYHSIFKNGRFHSLNLLSLSGHNTVEFRFFNSSIDWRKIKSRIKFLLTLIEEAISHED